MSRAAELTRLIEKLIGKKRMDEGDLDGELVVEGKDWRDTMQEFNELSYEERPDHDIPALDEIIKNVVHNLELWNEKCVYSVISVRDSSRGRKSYNDYLVRMNFAVPQDVDPKDFEREIQNAYQNAYMRRSFPAYCKRFGVNVRYVRKEGVLTCKISFTIYKTGI